MFLTINRVRDFDDAIQSRIHLAFRYNPLGVDTKKGIWDTFLKNAITVGGEVDYSDENLDDLARHDLNSRQVGVCFVEAIVHTLIGSCFRLGMSSGQRMLWRPRKGL
jgi:hypothetical protein